MHQRERRRRVVVGLEHGLDRRVDLDRLRRIAKKVTDHPHVAGVRQLDQHDDVGAVPAQGGMDGMPRPLPRIDLAARLDRRPFQVEGQAAMTDPLRAPLPPAACAATLLIAIGTLALTIYLYVVIPKGFFPVQDTGVILGVSEATISRMRRGEYPLENKPFELAIMFIRLYRSLDAVIGGDDAVAKSWLRNKNSALKEAPIDLIQSVSGLTDVIQYLDARRAVV